MCLSLILIQPQTGCFGNSLFEFPEVTASSKSGTEAFPVSGGYGLAGRGHTVLSLPDSVSDPETPGSGAARRAEPARSSFPR